MGKWFVAFITYSFRESDAYKRGNPSCGFGDCIEIVLDLKATRKFSLIKDNGTSLLLPFHCLTLSIKFFLICLSGLFLTLFMIDFKPFTC